MIPLKFNNSSHSWLKELLPQKFNGEDLNYTVENFKFAVNSWFSNLNENSSELMDDYDKIGWIGQFLTGHPARWWATFGLEERDNAPPQRLSLVLFWEQMNSYYGIQKKPFENELTLLRLQQGDGDIAKFNRKFRQLSASIDWSKEKLEAALYMSKLNETFINHLKSTPPLPRNIDALMDKNIAYFVCAYYLSSPTEPSLMMLFFNTQIVTQL